MKQSFARISRAWWLAVPLLAVLYLSFLSRAGVLGPDEPRYAAVGREMADSGDWITPRLWGQPWFEKPVLLYWMTATGFTAGLNDDLAPRVPVALLSIAFLIFFQWILVREFGAAAAWTATIMLATSAAWLGYSFIGATDLPMSATFGSAMLLSLEWLSNGNRRRLPFAAALLGAAVLAKGLVPLVLTLPLLWMARRRWRDLLAWKVAAAFLAVSLPWYVLCFLRNGSVFPRTFFWQQHFERFATDSLAHGQPFWFYAPVLAACLLPWTPFLGLLFQRALYSDVRRRFLLVWLCFGLLFFSLSKNKLPGYVLPLMPAAAALTGTAFAETRRARWALPAAVLCMVTIPMALPLAARMLASGLSHVPLPTFDWTWLLPLPLAGAAWWLDRTDRRGLAVAISGVVLAVSLTAVKWMELPLIDRAYSARPLWREIATRADQVCIAQMYRSWRYGLNYYSGTPLPDCAQSPRPLTVTQAPGQPPVLRAAP